MSSRSSSPDLDITRCNVHALEEVKQKFPNLDEVTIANHLLYAGGGEDIRETVKHINAMLQWREAALPITTASIAKEGETGKLFTRGTDKLGHPLIIYNSALNDPNTRDLEDLEKLFIFMLETALKQLKATIVQCSKLINGAVDRDKLVINSRERCKVTVLINRANGQKYKPDFEFLKRVGSIIERYYPLRIHRVYVYPTGLLVKSAWQVVKRFLPPIANDLLRPKISFSALRDVVSEEYLPVDMGGASNYRYDTLDFPSPFLNSITTPTEANLAEAAAAGHVHPRVRTIASDEPPQSSTRNSSRHHSRSNTPDASYAVQQHHHQGADTGSSSGYYGSSPHRSAKGSHSPPGSGLSQRGHYSDYADDNVSSPHGGSGSGISNSPRSPGGTSWSSAARK